MPLDTGCEVSLFFIGGMRRDLLPGVERAELVERGARLPESDHGGVREDVAGAVRRQARAV